MKHQHTKEFLNKANKMFHGCVFCGNADVWPHGIASSTRSCRQCYQTDIPLEIKSIFFDKTDKYNSARVRELEWLKLQREYYRDKRIKNGIIEPDIQCKKCRKEKPLFEFPIQWPYSQFNKCSDLDKLYCYDCLSIINDTKRCPRCWDVREKEDFRDDEFDYTYCIVCRKKVEEEKKIRDEAFLNEVPVHFCKSSLKQRGIKETEENINFIRELILAKRINRNIKSILRKEK